MAYKAGTTWFWDVIRNGTEYIAVAGTWALSAVSGSYDLRKILQNSTAAQNDEIAIAIQSESAQTRTLYIKAGFEGSMGISTISIDVISQGTIDWYSAATNWNKIQSIPVNLTKGVNALNIKMATKHASASAYNFTPQAMWLI